VSDDADPLRLPVVLTFPPRAGELRDVPPAQRAKAVLKLLQRRFGFSVTWMASEGPQKEAGRPGDVSDQE